VILLGVLRELGGSTSSRPCDHFYLAESVNPSLFSNSQIAIFEKTRQKAIHDAQVLHLMHDTTILDAANFFSFLMPGVTARQEIGLASHRESCLSAF
jgi:hypothetical protein